MTRDDVTRNILSAKRRKGVSWKQLVAEIGGGTADYVTAGVIGQMKLRPEQAQRAAALIELDEEEKRLLQEIPYRGSLPTAVPTDPLIYRFYELVQVYGSLSITSRTTAASPAVSAKIYTHSRERPPG